MNSNFTIEDAFEILQTAVEEAISSVQDAGADAMRQRDFDTAERIIKQARALDKVRDQIEELQASFEKHVISQVDQNSNYSRLRKGLKKPQEAYRIPILEALAEMGGRGTLSEVLDRVYQKMKHQFNEHDLSPLPSDNRTPRWKNTAQWSRNTLRSEGYLRDDSPRGVWEISDKGYALIRK